MVVSLNVQRLQLNGSLVIDDGFVGFIGSGEEDTEVDVSLNDGWAKFERRFVLADRIIVLTRCEIDICQVEVGIGTLGKSKQAFAQTFGCSVRIASLLKGICEVKARFQEIRQELDGAAKVGNGSVELAHLFVGIGQGELGPRECGLQSEGFAEVSHRIRRLTEGQPRHAGIMVDLDGIRLQSSCFVEVLNCFLRAARLKAYPTQKRESPYVGRVGLQHRATQCLGMSKVACVMEAPCLAEGFIAREHAETRFPRECGKGGVSPSTPVLKWVAGMALADGDGRSAVFERRASAANRERRPNRSANFRQVRAEKNYEMLFEMVRLTALPSNFFIR
jgi:hypothetical protein